MKRMLALFIAGTFLVLLCACADRAHDSAQETASLPQNSIEEVNTSIETLRADEVEEKIPDSEKFTCNADYFSRGNTIVPLEQAECRFEITYISENGTGGYDWDFTVENESAVPLSVNIMAFLTSDTTDNEARTWCIDAEPGEQISDIISWEQPYTVFWISVEPEGAESVSRSFIVEYR